MNILTKIGHLFLLALGTLIVSLLTAGCGGERKVAPVAVGEMTEYRDPGIGFRIQYLKGWVPNTEVGRARFYNAADVDKKFLDPTGPDPSGVEISVDAKKAADVAGALKQIRDDLAQAGTLGQEEQVTVAGVQGAKIPFKANYGGNNILTGHHILFAADSIVYDLGFAGFGDYYNAYAAVFDASLKSFQPQKPAVKGRDETLPSETYTSGDTKYFTYQYPENFNFSTPAKSAFEFSLELRGYRQDCSIRFDVFDAKKLTVEKVFEQNKGKYKSRGTGKANIGGESALYVSYAATPQVDSRAYFAVHNDKVYRITTNWFKSQEKEYIAAFEKMITSIKFK